MPTTIDRRQIIHACVGFGALLMGQPLVLSQCFAAGAQSDVEIEKMKRALIPPPTRTRRGGSEPLTAERQTVERLKTARQRRGGLNLQERNELYEATRQMPQLDLEIFFAFDSAELQPEATSRLDKLGQVLADPALHQNNIVIGGHTDRKGSAEYNQGLSERRAASVANYLVSKFGLDRNNLVAVGYGFEQLKNASDPLAAENRRVQVVNGQRP
jgi:outer membrane protein OmpA-like peptidoglycan-associated protein